MTTTMKYYINFIGTDGIDATTCSTVTDVFVRTQIDKDSMEIELELPTSDYILYIISSTGGYNIFRSLTNTTAIDLAKNLHSYTQNPNTFDINKYSSISPYVAEMDGLPHIIDSEGHSCILETYSWKYDVRFILILDHSGGIIYTKLLAL